MTEPEYSAEHLQVYEWPEAVRRYPSMYFHVGPGNPRLATEVLIGVVGDLVHPATAVAPAHSARVEVVVLDDLVFSVTDDLDDRWPQTSADTTLIPSWRLGAAAAAAVSTRTLVEVWRDGRGLRQELVDQKAVSETIEFKAPAGVGTRMVFTVDVEFVGAGSVITHELDGLDFHAPDCGLGTAGVELIDRRLLD